ncbi:ABC transporter substrate-binding protein [Microlunatus soli]|uniref:NitT/TauT family transport system substrate-binding protein n=1 Tax=Microlunatus soli TaxID=630515 RepID=A0A1H1TCP1_9ACTN|nr:ABC transporter substrate-binding protein [Microlunatus soli]SDS57736.1 NitT/TauT family transport system substrate-binding protein [Microlunatus soli]
MKRIISLAILITLTFATAACSGSSGGAGSGADQGGGKITVGYVPLPIFAPLFVADAKGYFSDAGLDVDLKVVKSGKDAVPLTASGKLDASLVGFSAGMFNAINSGLDVKVVGSMGVSDGDTEKPASALIVSKKLHDSGKITTVADLKGHKIGALGGSGATSAFYTGMALEDAGLSIKDVTFTPLDNPDIETGIKSGSIDGSFVSAPFWNKAVDDGVAVKLWTTPKNTSGTGVIFGGDFVTSPDAEKFYQALAKGAADLQGDARYSEENLKIIGDATEQTPEQVKSVPLYTWFSDLKPLPDQLAAMERMWIELGALDYDKPLPADKYVDTSFAEAATHQGS